MTYLMQIVLFTSHPVVDIVKSHMRVNPFWTCIYTYGDGYVIDEQIGMYVIGKHIRNHFKY